MDAQGYIIDQGLMDYEKARDLQRRLWSKRVEGELADLLLIVEHPHVITLGRCGNRSHLIASSEGLKEMKIPLSHVERAGMSLTTAPGRWWFTPFLI